MIIGKGRVLVVPEPEVRIGTVYDNQAETRQIRLHRFSPGGIDLGNLDFHLDLRYENKWEDTCLLEKETSEEHILLTWLVPESCLSHPGTVWIAVRGSNGDGAVKWATVPCPMYVDKTVGPPEDENILTELEQYEKLIEDTKKKADEVIASYEAFLEKANQAIQKAEETRAEAERKSNEAIQKAEQIQEAAEAKAAEVMGKAEETLADAKAKAQEASGFADAAEAWAHGKEGYPDNEADNSKYWSGRAETAYEDAKKQADRAMAYADFVVPDFLMDNNRVYINAKSKVEFLIDKNKLYCKLPA